MSKRCIPILQRGSVRLRLLEEADLETTLSWRNENRRWFVHSDPLTIGRHRAWFHQYIERDDDFVFVIEQSAGRAAPVGQVALYEIQWEDRTAEFGRLLIGEPAARRTGIAGKATEILLDYAFAVMGIRTIRLKVLESNLAAISLYQKCGFVKAAAEAGLIAMTKERDCPAAHSPGNLALRSEPPVQD